MLREHYRTVMRTPVAEYYMGLRRALDDLCRDDAYYRFPVVGDGGATVGLDDDNMEFEQVVYIDYMMFESWQILVVVDESRYPEAARLKQGVAELYAEYLTAARSLVDDLPG
jgi:hypothetical protein